MDSSKTRKAGTAYTIRMVFAVCMVLCLYFGFALAQDAAGVASAAQAQGVQLTPDQVSQYLGERTLTDKPASKGEAPAIELGEPNKPEQKPGVAAVEAAKANAVSSPIELLLSGQAPVEVSKALKQFGYDVFSRPGSSFDAIMNVPVGPDYVVGPGDSFTVTMWGRQNDRISVTVDRDGKIALPEVGVLTVSGMPFGKLQDYLESELKRKYTDFRMHISMGRLRTITVYVTGEAVVPGSHTLSSLSTIINALFAAGGPSKNGTLRNIQLLRTGQESKTIDLYDFLMGGDRSSDTRLQDSDTIYIPLIGPVVGVAGNVKRPAIYEMTGPMALEEVLALGGGVNYAGWLQRVQIERVQDHQRRVIADFDLSQSSANNEQRTANNQPPVINNQQPIPTGQLATPIHDGDIIKIFSISGEEQNVVRLEGHVVRPGKYELKPGMKLSDVLHDDTFLPQVNLEYAEIERLVPPDFHPIIIPFNLGQLLKGEQAQDKELTRFDIVRLFRWDEKGKTSVSISGRVYGPAEYRLIQGMKVKDLVEAAGGLEKNANTKRATLTRRFIDTSGMHTQEFNINLEKALNDDPGFNTPLQDLDELEVFPISEFGFNEQAVSIAGLVFEPNEYRLFEGMRIRDLIIQAGGLRKNAYLDKAELTRSHVTQTGMAMETLEVNLEKAFAGDPEQNVLLEDYDYLVVRPVPQLTFGQTVEIVGEVKFPGTYPMKKGERLSSLIERAGGYTPDAYLKGAVFTRETAKEIQQKRMDDMVQRLEGSLLAQSSQTASAAIDSEAVAIQKSQTETQQALIRRLRSLEPDGRVVVKMAQLDEFADDKYNLVLEDGDRLSIPKTPGIVTVVGEVFNPTALLYEGGQSVKYYLAKVGGMTKDADKKQISVIRADGSVVSIAQNSSKRITWDKESRTWHSGGFMNIKMNPGDTLVVPAKLDRMPWLRTTKDLTQIMFQMALSAGVVLAL